MTKAFAELNPAGDRIEVHFRYEVDLYRSVKSVPGARFVDQTSGGPFWTVPLDLSIARRLNEEFGDRLVLGKGLKLWGKEAVKREKNLQTLATIDDLPAEQLKLNKKLPELAEWLRGYQRADIKMLSEGSILNANEQRLGKTPETIGAIFEADLEAGPHLIVAPRTSLETVWRFEIERWTAKLERPHEVITYHGGLSKIMRDHALDEFFACIDDDWPVWFITTADMVRRGEEPDIEWATFVIDEYHRTGLPNAVGGNDRTKGSKFSWAARDIKARRRYALSGTPIGGKPIKLWGALNFLYPTQFASKWNWAKTWLNVSGNGFGQEVGGIQHGREDEFYKFLQPYMIRRLRSEVMSQLPSAQWIDVWCDMTPKQAKQYADMANRAEIQIEEKSLNAIGILAEYTRLKQFADAYAGEIRESRVRCEACGGAGEIGEHGQKCAVCGGIGVTVKNHIVPSSDSGKLPALLERLAENGIDPDDMEGESVAVVASQFKEIVDMVHKYLNEKGIKAVKITGDTKDEERTVNQMLFRKDGTRTKGDARVICMTTTAGGVAITLDLADNVHILDETWVPDDQEQLADRVFSASRMKQVGVYVYRSNGTIEEYIQRLTKEKGRINREVLDLRRQGFRANIKDAAALEEVMSDAKNEDQKQEVKV